MILQALVDHYEALAARGDISRPGFGFAKISHALDISDAGELLAIQPLKTEAPTGKKLLPREMELPALPKKRAVDITANFLWDNAIYLLGLDARGNPQRAKLCFEAAKALHLRLLGGVDNAFAKAVCAFFENWNPDTAADNPLVAELVEELAAGGNLTFMFENGYPDKNPVMMAAWQRHYDGERQGEMMRCLITGEHVVPEETHPPIKKVRDAQPTGAALISFNASAFCSYDREQNLNAPVGKYAAFAYTTALNRLLADSENVVYIGDASVVFWAESAQPQYPSAFALWMNDDADISNAMTGQTLHSVLDKLSQGIDVDWDGVPLKPDNRFYVLGLSPNASRLSVRFFLRDSFGRFAAHVKAHYDRLEIAKPAYEKMADMPLWKLMRETVNPNASDKKSSPQMSGDTLRAILTGGRYPATLYQSVQMRIRADRNISYRRAAIIKAYLLRNSANPALKEALTVELNENTTYQPYIRGRMFSVLEAIQEAANPGINTTIKDKYLSSACETPAKVFPTLLKLAEKHLRKMEKGAEVYYSKQLVALMALLGESHPAHHTLEDQGTFQIGYYHQQQKRYEKKTTTDNKEVDKP